MDSYEINSKETFEISLIDIFRIFKKGLWLMVVAAIVFGAAAFGYSKIFIPKKYTTNVQLYVDYTGSNNNYSVLSDRTLATGLVDTYIKILDTRDFREKLAANLDNKYTEKQLAGMVSFSRDDKTNTEVFTARVSAKSPTEAKIIGDAIADVAPDVMSAMRSDTELKIVDRAQIPTYPSSPNVTRNTLIAAIAGFALALAFVFLRELLDNKLKFDNDMTAIDSIPILAAVPDSGDERIILGMETEQNSGEGSEEQQNG